jgi:cbb3-type cytochrome oxidase subunit 3
MTDWIWLFVFVACYYGVTQWLLPKLGINT